MSEYKIFTKKGLIEKFTKEYEEVINLSPSFISSFGFGFGLDNGIMEKNSKISHEFYNTFSELKTCIEKSFENL